MKWVVVACEAGDLFQLHVSWDDNVVWAVSTITGPFKLVHMTQTQVKSYNENE